jgi:hypothetical protein
MNDFLTIAAFFGKHPMLRFFSAPETNDQKALTAPRKEV